MKHHHHRTQPSFVRHWRRRCLERKGRNAAPTPAEERAMLAAAQALARHDAWLALEALSIGGRWRLLAARGTNRAVRLGEVEERTVARMRALGLLNEVEPGRWRLSGAGRRWLLARTPAHLLAPGRAAEADGKEKERPQRPPRKATQRRMIHDPESGHLREAAVNVRENPLLWLARRTDAQGRPLLEAHHVAAGERLRADYETACMQPGQTTNWDAALTAHDRSRLRSGPRDPFPMTERVIAARERVWRALSILPPEQADIALRICCLAQGLEAAERVLGWPRRSARLILRMALQQLAAHYGLLPKGREQGGWRRLLAWHAPHGKPSELVPAESKQAEARQGER